MPRVYVGSGTACRKVGGLPERLRQHRVGKKAVPSKVQEPASKDEGRNFRSGRVYLFGHDTSSTYTRTARTGQLLTHQHPAIPPDHQKKLESQSQRATDDLMWLPAVEADCKVEVSPSSTSTSRLNGS